MWDRWFSLNLACAIGYDVAVVYFCGWPGFLYLVFAFLFSIGLHPVGARWIQEHYVFAPGQETYSYYGPLNLVAFNIGYHNEHHDIATIPWSRLPRLRAMAPEFYDGLYAHRSWTALLIAFMRDADITLCNRIVRRSGRAAPSVPPDLASCAHQRARRATHPYCRFELSAAVGISGAAARRASAATAYALILPPRAYCRALDIWSNIKSI